MPVVRRTRATLRSAEFGFFGVVVYTRVQTPRRCGAPLSAAVFVFSGFDSRPLRTSCSMVGTTLLAKNPGDAPGPPGNSRNGPRRFGGAPRQPGRTLAEGEDSRSNHGPWRR